MTSKLTAISQEIPAVVGSRRFWLFVVGLFIAQAVLFAFLVPTSQQKIRADGYVTRTAGVVPDGHRHIGAMYYYAEQPLLTGPFISDMDERDLWMGDLVRFPSYLYQYLMSFPVRVLSAVGLSDQTIVMTIRLLGVLIGLAALVVFRKIALEVKAGRVVANLAALSLALTGSFVYLSPAENYDIMALALFFGFLLASIRLFTRNNWLYLYWMLVIFLFLGITKYTYIPFAGLVGLAAVALAIRQQGWREARQYAVKQWRGATQTINRWKLIGLVILALVGGGLFVERIGVNLATYRSFNPNCKIIHSHQGCMRFGVYARNYNRSLEVDAEPAGAFKFQPLDYASQWIARYFSSMYMYLGHIWIYDVTRLYSIVSAASLLVVLLATSYAKLRRVKLLPDKGQKLLLATAVLTIVAQIGFNLNTVLNYHGSLYAHQGRYLMAAAGLLYIVILLVLARSLGALPAARQPQARLALAVFGGLVLLAMSPLLSYWLHAWSADWYSLPVRDWLPGWWFDFREFVFYDVIGKFNSN